jgi:hypothetical protein
MPPEHHAKHPNHRQRRLLLRTPQAAMRLPRIVVA